MNELQIQAKALGDPTRFKIYRYIVDSNRDVNVAELTKLVGFNHNAVRQHLNLLVSAGLVIEELELRTQPGRPRLLYRLSPEAEGSFESRGPYSWLAGVLARALADKKATREIGIELGKEVSEQEIEYDIADRIEVEMIKKGFKPERTDKRTAVDIKMERCPFAEVAKDLPELICQFHLGYVEGMAEGEDISVQLVPKDPTKAGCRIIMERSKASV